MKPHFIIAVCFGLIMWSMVSQSQNLVWANQFGSTGKDCGKSITVDANGNVYATGHFRVTVDFDPGPSVFNLISSGEEDVFIIKLNVSGDLIWAKRIGSFGFDKGNSIFIDTMGSVYVAGSFSNTVDFDPGLGTFNLTSIGGWDAFVLKLDAAGNFVWAKQMGGIGDQSVNSITVDASGNVYSTGWFGGTCDFDPGPGTYDLAAAGQDIFISKLDTIGNFVWAKQVTNLTGMGVSMGVDNAGNTYITGFFSGTADFDPGAGSYNLITTGGTRNSFVLKLDAFGSLAWAREIDGINHNSGQGIAIDISGNVIVAGLFNGGAFFYPPGVSDTLGTIVTSSDIFIAKLDNSGNWKWAKQMGGGGMYPDAAYALTLDSAGSIYTTGLFTVSGDFDPGPAVFNLTTVGGPQLFISKLDSSGNFVWATNTDRDVAKSAGIAVDIYGVVYVIGSFQSTVDFDPSGTFNLTSAGDEDVFIFKLTQPTPYLIRGTVFGDLNADCGQDTSDLLFSGTLIKAEPGPSYGLSNDSGNFIVYLPVAGNYTISVITQDTLWHPSCTTSYNVQITGTSDTINGVDFALNAASYCSRLSVELATPRLRRCSNNTYTFTYRNTGTLPASSTYIEVDFGEYLQPQSSTLQWSTVSGNTYKFPIGDLNIYSNGSFNVTAFLDCNTELGSTQCVTAHIYPDSICGPPSIGWDKSETKVTGGCVNDSLVCFQIKNRSSSPGGDMQGTAPWRLYINDTLMTQGDYQLTGGDSLIQCYPANGKTYRLEADQRLGHPGNSHPQAIVEGCGSPDNFGFVNTVPQDDEDLFVETFCMEVMGSFDPNDKQVFPTGITSNKYIKEDAELEYLIRFQNTGNDTAFKVVIRDTIQTDVIDIATLTSGASSHDYTFNIYSHGIAEWTFDNILLPDSNVNEEASHGFVKFKAKLLPNIAPGTIVTNSADIYFDFNAPVITKEVWNTVFDTVIRGTVVISGNVLTESGVPVPGVVVKLSDAATDSVVTTTDGSYSFEVESGHDYSISPSKNNDSIPSNGITTYDILRMRQHLLGMGALSSPYKIIAAAEVNAVGDTVVTTQDIVFLRSLILANTSSFPGNRLWQFVNSDYLFPDAQHPFSFNKTRTYSNIISNQTNQNFIGIKLGDVNESLDE